MRAPQRPRPAKRGRPLRPLLALRRRPRAWWAVVASLAVGVGAWVGSITSGAQEASSRWGQGVAVLTLVRSVAAGEAVDPQDVQVTRRPAALVPAQAVAQLPEAAVARVDLVEGEVLVAPRIASASSALAAVLPQGSRAVAVPVEPGSAPPLQPGDLVDVVVALAPEAAEGGPPGFTLTTGALVVDVGEQAVTVAVDPGDVPRIAVALGAGAVSLALVPAA